jgi:hypothetical protein
MAALAGGYVAARYHNLPVSAVSDFDAIWTAARALAGDADPYAAVRSPPWPWTLQYPLPAVVVALPFSIAPLPLARVAFMAVSVGTLAFLLTRRAWWPLLMLLSGPVLVALWSVQWSILLTAAVLLPPLGAVLAAKPTTALPLVAAYPSRAALVGGVALTVLAFILEPGWVAGWWSALRGAPHQLGLLRPAGVVLLLALLRWRLPEGRQVAAIALVPLSPHLYEAVPLALVARSRGEMLALTLCGTLGLAAERIWPSTHVPDHSLSRWWIVFCAAYLPALVIVLRRPPRAAAAEPFVAVRLGSDDHGAQR